MTTCVLPNFCIQRACSSPNPGSVIPTSTGCVGADSSLKPAGPLSGIESRKWSEYTLCGAPLCPSTRCGITAAESAVACDPVRLARDDAIAVDHEPRHLRAVHQRGAPIERGGNRRDQHRLLGVGGTTHAAIAEVRAALHVALDHRGGNADLFAATPQQVIVLVGRDRPGCNAQALFDALEPGLELGLSHRLQPELVAPIRKSAGRRAEARSPVD